MSDHKRGEQTTFPMWLTATIVLGDLALLFYSVIAFGPEGYPIDMMLGGILGGYAGLDQLLKRRQVGTDDPPKDAP